MPHSRQTPMHHALRPHCPPRGRSYYEWPQTNLVASTSKLKNEKRSCSHAPHRPGLFEGDSGASLCHQAASLGLILLLLPAPVYLRCENLPNHRRQPLLDSRSVICVRLPLSGLKSATLLRFWKKESNSIVQEVSSSPCMHSMIRPSQ